MSDDINTPMNEDRLRELSEALRAEFEMKESGTTRQTALKDLEDLKPDFLKALKHTVTHSMNESLVSKVSMWGYDRLLEEGKASKDPLADLLSALPPSVPAQND